MHERSINMGRNIRKRIDIGELLESSKIVLRSKIRFTVGKAFSVILSMAILATACTFANEIPPNEVRAGKLNKVIMCPICPGESIDQASNDLSIQMRGIVRQQVDEGMTDEQIKQFWIERYGPSVVLEPPREGFAIMAWLLPPIGVAIAVFALFFTLRWMRRSPGHNSSVTNNDIQLTEKELSYYAERIESMLDSEGDKTGGHKESRTSASIADGAS